MSHRPIKLALSDLIGWSVLGLMIVVLLVAFAIGVCWQRITRPWRRYRPV